MRPEFSVGKLFNDWVFLICVSLIVCGWVILTLRLVGIDVLEKDGEPTSVTFLLWLAIGFSVVFTPLAIFRFFRAKQLFTHGVVVDAVPADTGLIQYKGMKNVVYVFEYDGRGYTVKISEGKLQREQTEQQGHITLLVDPRNPKRYIPI